MLPLLSILGSLSATFSQPPDKLVIVSRHGVRRQFPRLNYSVVLKSYSEVLAHQRTYTYHSDLLRSLLCLQLNFQI